MLHVQIASRLPLAGVDGIRWVLVDDSDAPSPDAAPAPAAVEAAAPKLAPAEEAARSRVSLALMKSLVMGAGLGAAIWMAQTNFGPPTVRWWQDPPALPKAGTLAPVPLRSAPQPAGGVELPRAPEPAAPAASAALPTLTAANR
ncbi:MAG: hypothetical protein CFE45_24195 [Burkholderiales bacterium PBB5]|nr:MAG: hypothetical protein CFE45_24195 [Burkholderiales bacterium PBB5]